MQKWILGSLALAAGIIPPTTPLASAQDGVAPNTTPTEVALQTGASAPQALPPLLVWDSQATSLSKIGPWGNGLAQTTNGRTGTTLQVTTRNLEEGVRFDLTKPVDLAPYLQTGFWRVRVQVNGATQRGGRGRGRGRNQAPGAAASADTPPLTQLRLKLVLDQGVMSGILPISNQSGRGNRGSQWQNLLLPVRSLTSSRAASGLVRRVILTGDSTGSFSLEQVSLVAETNRITATVRRATDPPETDLKTITVKPGRSTTLVADVNGGTSDINVAWNFNADNSVAFPPAAMGGGWNQPGAPGGVRGSTGGARGSAGAVAGPSGAVRGVPGAVRGNTGTGFGMVRNRVDATGLSARPNWPNEEQDYRIEVTITDRAGKKPPVKKSIQVQVRGGN